MRFRLKWTQEVENRNHILEIGKHQEPIGVPGLSFGKQKKLRTLALNGSGCEWERPGVAPESLCGAGDARGKSPGDRPARPGAQEETLRRGSPELGGELTKGKPSCVSRQRFKLYPIFARCLVLQKEVWGCCPGMGGIGRGGWIWVSQGWWPIFDILKKKDPLVS